MTIEVFLAAISAIAAVLALMKMYSPPVKEPIEKELLAFKAKFKLLQTIHLETQEFLERIIEKNDCGDTLFINGLTYSEYLILMKSNYPQSNSDETLEKILPLLTDNHSIGIFRKEVDDQYEALKPIHIGLKILFEK